jgi:hypothetical protein
MTYRQIQDQPVIPDEAVRKIGRLLEDESILSVSEVAQRMVMNPGAVREALEAWVHSGRVEVLRPYRKQPVDDNDLDYYRWKQDADDKYVWEQAFLDGCPYCGNMIKPRHSLMEMKGFMKQFALRWAVGMAT